MCICRMDALRARAGAPGQQRNTGSSLHSSARAHNLGMEVQKKNLILHFTFISDPIPLLALLTWLSASHAVGEAHKG